MLPNLLIVGAGQYGLVVREIAESMNCFDRIEFIDDNSPIAIGRISELSNFRDKFESAFVAIGNAKFRIECIEKLESFGFQVATLIHPQAFVSKQATLGIGTIVEPLAIVQANCKIGKGVLICSGAVIKHNSVVDDGAYIDCNSTVAGSIVPKFTRTPYNEVFKI